MTPTTPGVYRLRLPSGEVVRRKCLSMNGCTFAVVPGRLWIFSALVPLDLVEGEWL